MELRTIAMQYTFGSFQFNCQTLILEKDRTPVDIRHNEAKVLSLLLANKDNVLSKDEILAQVWRDKVVSEQAVFQCVSNLRGLFGSDAIKTYSKRGYQWQLPLVQPASREADAVFKKSTKNNASQSALTPTSQTHKASWLFAFAASFVLLFWLISRQDLSQVPQPEEVPIELAYFAFDTQGTEPIRLKNSIDLRFTHLGNLSSTEFQTSSELEYPKIAPQHPFILTGQQRLDKGTHHLDFQIKGPYSSWQGQLSGQTLSELETNFTAHISQRFIYASLSRPASPELIQANLSIAHQAVPEDLIVLGHLTKSYIDTQELEKAMVMADKLASLASKTNDHQQVGNALLYQSQILTQKELFALSSEKLQLAVEHFKAIGDLKREADAWNAQSWLDHKINAYSDIKVSLLRSAELAHKANDKARELHALTYLSVLAHKHKQQQDKYLYLRRAEEKMLAYELPIYHFAKVPFHYAIFAADPLAKEPHLKQVLEFTQLTPDHWVAQSARRQLVQNYIAQQRLDEARDLVLQASVDNMENSYLKALLAQAEQDDAGFIRHAQRAFEQSQLSGDLRRSLDIALLLISAPRMTVNFDFYSKYIEDNANHHWRRNNQQQLLALQSKEQLANQ